MMTKKILIFGYGYVAKFLSKQLSKIGWEVYCTSRNIMQINSQQDNPNIKLIPFKDIESAPSSWTAILSTVPPNAKCDPVLNEYLEFIISQNSLWIGYLSSTGIYGDHNGNWVNEETICIPNNTAKARLSAEQKWLHLYLKYNLPVHIFRLSGIYGPKRNCLEKIKNGKDFTIFLAKHYFSRIHVFDICNALIASIQKATPGQIYNLADDEPAELHLVEQYAAKLMKVPKLSEISPEEANLSPMARSFFATNKRVSNKKVCSFLNIKCLYPNYRVGLSSLLQNH